MGVNRFFLLLLHRFGFYVRTDNTYKYPIAKVAINK